MKIKFFVSILIFSFFAVPLFAGEVESNSFERNIKNEIATDNLQAETAESSKEISNAESYIPLSDSAKRAIYWSIKGTTLALSSIYLIAELVYPISPVNSNDSYSRGYAWPMFAPFCHGLNSRSFQYSNGRYMPLCARCTGINVGVFAGHFDSFIWDSFQIKDWERWQQGLLHIGLYSLLTVPLFVDGIVQQSSSYESNNALRFVTGILFGYATTAIADEILQLILDYKGDIKKTK